MSIVQRSCFSPCWKAVNVVNDFLKKIAAQVSAIWNKLCDVFRSIFCCANIKITRPISHSHKSSINERDPYHLIEKMKEEVDKYRLGRPLTFNEKASLQAKKEELEAVFVKDKLKWEASSKVGAPAFVQYQKQGISKEVCWLLIGKALEKKENIIPAALNKYRELKEKVEQIQKLNRPLQRDEISNLIQDELEYKWLESQASQVFPDEWVKVKDSFEDQLLEQVERICLK